MSTRTPVLTAIAVVAAGAAALALAACGEGSSGGSRGAGTAAGQAARSTGSSGAAAAGATATAPLAPPPPPPPPALAVAPAREPGNAWQPVARVHGHVAAWQSQRGGAALLRFDQRYVRLDLHAGEGEPEGSWRYGGRIESAEIHHVIAAFNGGFKFSTGAAGWMQAGRVAEPLRAGRGSIVTYRDGTSEIGAWRASVPAANRPVYSVLQNLALLVDRGAPAATVESCIQSCWGATLGGGDSVARSGIGERADGQLVWAAGEQLTPAALARALADAGARWAVELDINPEWVAGYLYAHSGEGPRAVPVVPGQNGIAGQFLQPYTRDFFAVVAR
ncbi:MAG TPA: hypothetical protein VGD00_07005 [Solirubrobacteraceae bacterium]